MTTFFLTLLGGSIAIMFIVISLYNNKVAHVQNIKRVYEALHSGGGMDHTIRVMSNEMSKMGISVLDCFTRNRHTMQLESEKAVVPILESSSLVKALFTQQPHHSDCRYEVDAKLSKALGTERIAYIPFQTKRISPCWQINNCQDKHCKCHSSRPHACWTESEKRYRGDFLSTYADKHRKCLDCPAFLPLGVLAVKDTSTAALLKAHSFINDNFSGALKTAVNFEKTLHSASTDHLTGILNKRSLIMSLKSLIKLSLRYEQPLSFAMIDIDHFKNFNDTYGHPTGDFLLRELAQLLSSLVRETDVVARYGGEEFSVIFPNTDKKAAVAVANKVRKIIQEHAFEQGEEKFTITVSMGVSSYPEDDIDSITTLIAKADVALYAAKVKRNKVSAFDSKMPNALKKEMKPEKPLPRTSPKEKAAPSVPEPEQLSEKNVEGKKKARPSKKKEPELPFNIGSV